MTEHRASAGRRYYRRRAKARQEAALAQAIAAREAVLDRLAWQVAELRASLDRCAVAHEVMYAELMVGFSR
jgi:flavin-binding protein dodecin